MRARYRREYCYCAVAYATGTGGRLGEGQVGRDLDQVGARDAREGPEAPVQGPADALAGREDGTPRCACLDDYACELGAHVRVANLIYCHHHVAEVAPRGFYQHAHLVVLQCLGC
jgi:hypothetical protein